METRPFTPDDVAAVEAFLDRIPKGESTFFKEDITADGIVRRWAADTADSSHPGVGRRPT